MGYATQFTGQISVTPPLNRDEIAYLQAFADSRRWDRPEGPYAMDDDWDMIEAIGGDLGVSLPEGQPSAWCEWAPTADGAAIQWGGADDVDDAVEWMRYLISTFLAPDASLKRELGSPVAGRSYAPELHSFTFNHNLNGAVHAQGERPDSRWELVVTDNNVASSSL